MITRERIDLRKIDHAIKDAIIGVLHQQDGFLDNEPVIHKATESIEAIAGAIPRYQSDSNFHARVNMLAYAVINSLQKLLAELSQADSAWINVKDRLPQTQKMILCYMPLSYNGSNGIHYGWLNFEPNGNPPVFREHSPNAYAHRMEDEMYTGIKNSQVTHWMPLPKPPAIKE